MFHIFFMSRYSRNLEESSFRGRTADFAWLILYSSVSLLVCSTLSKTRFPHPCPGFFKYNPQRSSNTNLPQILSPIASMPFLGSPLSFSLVYIWARRNPSVRLSFLGLFVFTAPYLPWVLLGFSLLLHNTLPKDDLLGIVVGHVYYFFSDIYPRIRNGSRPLDPPEFWRRLFAPRTAPA